VVTSGAAPGEQTFAANDARAPIGFAIAGDLLEDRAALVAELHDEIRVTEDQRPLMRRTKAFHFHRDALATARVQR
jgi:hypothetical protein